MNIAELEKIDIKTMTMKDLEKVQNPVLKAAMMDALRRKMAQISAEYTSHNQHTDHASAT